jgi:hypothetical protein
MSNLEEPRPGATKAKISNYGILSHIFFGITCFLFLIAWNLSDAGGGPYYFQGCLPALLSLISYIVGFIFAITSILLNRKSKSNLIALCLHFIPPLAVFLFYISRPGPLKPTPVTATFVLSKLHYGGPNEDEREILCFERAYESRVSYPDFFGSMKRYRTIGWAREANGGDRIFQTYDLLSDRMDRSPVNLVTPKNNRSGTYQDNGWRPKMPEDLLSFHDDVAGLKSGSLEVRLDGIWERVTQSFKAYNGDVVIIVSGQEILKQRVERATARDLNQKCQFFIGHDLLVYLDGVQGKPGNAWFIDLTLGHPRPIQGPNDIFPSRANTPPKIWNTFDAVRVDGAPGTKFEEDIKFELGVPYRILLKIEDPDLEYGDEITRCDWELEYGKIITTMKPELIFTFKTEKMYQFWFRAYDKSGKPGPWCGTSVPSYMFEKDIPNSWREGTKQPPTGDLDPRRRLPPGSR